MGLGLAGRLVANSREVGIRQSSKFLVAPALRVGSDPSAIVNEIGTRSYTPRIRFNLRGGGKREGVLSPCTRCIGRLERGLSAQIQSQSGGVRALARISAFPPPWQTKSMSFPTGAAFTHFPIPSGI
jgi:hypothetical protein